VAAADDVDSRKRFPASFKLRKEYQIILSREQGTCSAGKWKSPKLLSQRWEFIRM